MKISYIFSYLSDFSNADFIFPIAYIIYIFSFHGLWYFYIENDMLRHYRLVDCISVMLSNTCDYFRLFIPIKMK